MYNFFHSTEFYIILFVIAAAVVGIFARPSNRGAAITHLIAGELSETPDSTPRIEIECGDDGTVTLRRYGVEGINTSGAVSIAVTLIGFDISIEERLVDGQPGDPAINTATFRLDFLGREHYHMKYNSQTSSRFMAATISNRPGFHAVKPLIHA